MGPPQHTHQGQTGVRVGARFRQHAAPRTSGRVLQALVGAQESFAVGAVVVHVLQGVHTERDEAAARDAPGGQNSQTWSTSPSGTGLDGGRPSEHRGNSGSDCTWNQGLCRCHE